MHFNCSFTVIFKYIYFNLQFACLIYYLIMYGLRKCYILKSPDGNSGLHFSMCYCGHVNISIHVHVYMICVCVFVDVFTAG